MTDTEPVTRRKFTSGMVASTVFGGLHNSFFDTTADTDCEIDVNLFVGRNHIDDFDESVHQDKTPYFVAERVAEHIEYAYTNLVSTFDESVGVNVSVIRTPIPTDELSYDIANTLLSSWESYLYDEIPHEKRASDANILITTRGINGNTSITGNAHAPCSLCDGGNHTAGVLYGMAQRPYVRMEPGQINTQCYAATPTAKIHIAVHEVGHTIGLRHTDGEIQTESVDEPHMTLMASTSDIPDDAEYAVRQLTFNDNITRSDLRLSEDGGIGERTEEPSLLDMVTRVVNFR